MIKTKIITKISKSFSFDEHIYEKVNCRGNCHTVSESINKCNKRRRAHCYSEYSKGTGILQLGYTFSMRN